MYTRSEPTQLNVKSAGTITNGAIFLSHGLASGSVCLFQSRFDDFFSIMYACQPVIENFNCFVKGEDIYRLFRIKGV